MFTLPAALPCRAGRVIGAKAAGNGQPKHCTMEKRRSRKAVICVEKILRQNSFTASLFPESTGLHPVQAENQRLKARIRSLQKEDGPGPVRRTLKVQMQLLHFMGWRKEGTPVEQGQAPFLSLLLNRPLHELTALLAAEEALLFSTDRAAAKSIKRNLLKTLQVFRTAGLSSQARAVEQAIETLNRFHRYKL